MKRLIKDFEKYIYKNATLLNETERNEYIKNVLLQQMIDKQTAITALQTLALPYGQQATDLSELRREYDLLG